MTKAITGSFLSFVDGVAILSDKSVFCLRILATLSPGFYFGCVSSELHS